MSKAVIAVRTILFYAAVVAALVNEREVVGHLPTEPWDVRVAALVTEAGVRWA